jgi:hypothetical protein
LGIEELLALKGKCLREVDGLLKIRLRLGPLETVFLLVSFAANGLIPLLLKALIALAALTNWLHFYYCKKYQ